MAKTADQIGQAEILRLLQARVERLANPNTALVAMNEVCREIRKVTGDKEHAERMFFEAMNFYDGILQGFDWGWRAARWKRPKRIEEVDRFAIQLLMDDSSSSNKDICKRLDRKKFKLSDRVTERNRKELGKRLGNDSVLWLWQTALANKIHAVEVALADFRSEAKQFSDALWWHKTVSRHYRKVGRLDWARRSAVIKAQAGLKIPM